VSDSGVIDKYGWFNKYGDCITHVINQNEFSELIQQKIALISYYLLIYRNLQSFKRHILGKWH
jgi:hypothetical protein